MADDKPATRVLVVEDAEDVSTLLDDLLRHEGFAVAIAHDGQEAVDYIASEPPADLAVLDIMLPYFDGFELIKKIRQSESWRAVPIVMLTAKAGPDDVARAKQLGANEYIPKPFQPRELIARLQGILRKGR